MKTVIVTGCTGQTGSYMVDFLLENTDLKVIGVIRKNTGPRFPNMSDSALKNPRFRMVYGDLKDQGSIASAVHVFTPAYFINLAAQSSPPASLEAPFDTLEINARGVEHCLRAIQMYAPSCRFFNAGTSAEFQEPPYLTPYGISKQIAHDVVSNYRDNAGLYAVQGILFNHDSERRGHNFLARKITSSVARIRKEIIDGKPIVPMELGNINGMKGWMHAEDVVRGIWLMINQPTPIEYELSSPDFLSIREFVSACFAEAGFVGQWFGNHFSERCLLRDLTIDPVKQYRWTANKEIVPGVVINHKFYKPTEEIVRPWNFEADEALGWSRKVEVGELIHRMVQNDIKLLDQ